MRVSLQGILFCLLVFCGYSGYSEYIKCECKCQKCGKTERFDDIIEYDEGTFEGYSYSDFKKLCRTSDLNLDKAIMENMIYVCDECLGDVKIVDILDGRVYYD